MLFTDEYDLNSGQMYDIFIFYHKYFHFRKPPFVRPYGETLRLCSFIVECIKNDILLYFYEINCVLYLNKYIFKIYFV